MKPFKNIFKAIIPFKTCYSQIRHRSEVKPPRCMEVAALWAETVFMTMWLTKGIDVAELNLLFNCFACALE